MNLFENNKPIPCSVRLCKFNDSNIWFSKSLFSDNIFRFISSSEDSASSTSLTEKCDCRQVSQLREHFYSQMSQTTCKGESSQYFD